MSSCSDQSFIGSDWGTSELRPWASHRTKGLLWPIRAVENVWAFVEVKHATSRKSSLILRHSETVSDHHKTSTSPASTAVDHTSHIQWNFFWTNSVFAKHILLHISGSWPITVRFLHPRILGQNVIPSSHSGIASQKCPDHIYRKSFDFCGTCRKNPLNIAILPVKSPENPWITFCPGFLYYWDPFHVLWSTWNLGLKWSSQKDEVDAFKWHLPMWHLPILKICDHPTPRKSLFSRGGMVTNF